MESQRITLRLDPEMLLEGLLLERLGGLPKHRRPDWLRSLLVSGFLQEGRVLREIRKGTGGPATLAANRDRPSGVPDTAFASWLGRPASGSAGPPTARPEALPVAEKPVAAPGGNKPFDHQRRVIG